MGKDFIIVLLSVLQVIEQIFAATVGDEMPVETKNGKIGGFIKTAAHGKDVSARYGIPYAVPPLGDLRFRHPQPIKTWEGVRKQTRSQILAFR